MIYFRIITHLPELLRLISVLRSTPISQFDKWIATVMEIVKWVAKVNGAPLPQGSTTGQVTLESKLIDNKVAKTSKPFSVEDILRPDN